MFSGLKDDQRRTLEGVNKVVIQALAKIVPTYADPQQSRKPLEVYLSRMYAATLSPEREALSQVVREMRRMQISSACIAEIYVPAIARRLGEGWVADTLDFAAVTLASSRLQSLLWRLEKDWSEPPRSVVPHAPSFLVGLPEGRQHSLGATVLAGQLRHLGMSVILDLELTAQSLRDHVTHRQLSAVLLSAAACDDLEGLRKLVDIVRDQSRNTPVIIGGGILEHTPDIQTLTRADFVTSSVHDVLWYCDASKSAMQEPLSIQQDRA